MIGAERERSGERVSQK